MYSVQCTVYSVQCTVYSVQCKVVLLSLWREPQCSSVWGVKPFARLLLCLTPPEDSRAVVGDLEMEWNLVVGDPEMEWNLVVGDLEMEWNFNLEKMKIGFSENFCNQKIFSKHFPINPIANWTYGQNIENRATPPLSCPLKPHYFSNKSKGSHPKKNFQDINFTPFRGPQQPNFTQFRGPWQPNFTPFQGSRQPNFTPFQGPRQLLI